MKSMPIKDGGCSAFFAAAEGFLVGKEPSRQESKAAWFNLSNELRRKRLSILAERHGLCPASAAVAYALSSGSTVVVVGCSNVAHFQDAVQGSRVTLTEDEIRYLEGANYTNA